MGSLYANKNLVSDLGRVPATVAEIVVRVVVRTDFVIVIPSHVFNSIEVICYRQYREDGCLRFP